MHEPTTPLLSTPPLTRRRCAACTSGTTSCKPRKDPGGTSNIPLEIWIEHPDPGGVSWTKRVFSSTVVSKSTTNPTCSA
jgi:hypothetical protein